MENVLVKLSFSPLAWSNPKVPRVEHLLINMSQKTYSPPPPKKSFFLEKSPYFKGGHYGIKEYSV